MPRTYLNLLLLCLCFASPRALAAQDVNVLLAALESSMTEAIEKAEKSVVAIARLPKEAKANSRARLNPLSLDIPLDLDIQLRNPEFVPTFFGSGVVLSKDGYILTCAHVLEDPRKNDYVVWLNGKSYDATQVSPRRPASVTASDPFSDLAVLKIEADNLQPIEFGDVSGLKKGRFVLALGNPDATARDGNASASWGIISNLSRVSPSLVESTKESIHEFGTLIQTDAKLNFGTSGGALIDLQGRMLGLTTSLTATKASEHSAGYAIAVDALFLRVVAELQQGKLPDFGFLGIQPDDLRMSDREQGIRGARIRLVLPGLPGTVPVSGRMTSSSTSMENRSQIETTFFVSLEWSQRAKNCDWSSTVSDRGDNSQKS